MTGSPALDTILFLCSLATATLISVAEFAIASASRSRLDAMADRDSIPAVQALHLKDHDESLQGATQIATLFLIIFSSFTRPV